MRQDTGADAPGDFPPNLDTTQILAGMPIYDADGEKVGVVNAFDPHNRYLAMQKGWFFPHDVAVPLDAISRQGADGLYLRFHKSDLKDLKWDQLPVGDTSDASATPRAGVIEPDHVADVPGGGAALTNASPPDAEAVNRGGTGSAATDAPTQALAPDTRYPDAFQERDFDVPIMGEELEVRKRPIITEEIRLHKDTTTATQQVSDTVRREQIHLDDAAPGDAPQA
jgi:hypothetical protein